MNGTAFPTSGLTLPTTNSGVGNVVNSQRISAVAEKLAICAQSKTLNDVATFYNLCISLSRGIDYAIASNDIPAQVSKLPMICKLVCQQRRNCHLQAAIMVLMVTMKHACNAHWFSTEETQELLALVEEVAMIFNTPEGISSEPTSIYPTISQIISRYYPHIKLGHILASVDIKPGFEACTMDIHVSKNMTPSKSERIKLLVAMKDKIDTSSCIINPPKVNIMLNGKGVLGRMIGCMELGPQLPTDVTNLLKYGTNLLQAIGQFDAHYIVLIAFMSIAPSSSLPVPEDYVQPDSGTVGSDAEVVEGPSRISLNCPISFTRIRKPAKGQLCKHLQCFDLDNYVKMNARHPSWRCPHCNQPVCYPGIRIDRKISKILEEVAEGVVNVTIHSDGSWEAISGSDDHQDEPNAKPSEVLQEGPDPQAASGLQNISCDVCDLTEADDEMVIDVDMHEDTKPIVQPEVNQNSSTQAQGLSSSALLRTFSGPADYSSRPIIEPVSNTSLSMYGHFNSSPGLMDSVSPAARQAQQSSPLASGPSVTKPLQPQRHLAPQMVGSVHGGNAIQRNVNRVPSVIQTTTGSRPVMSTRPAVNNFSGNTSSLPSRVSLPPPTGSTIASAARLDSVQQPHALDSSPRLEPHSTSQMRGLAAHALDSSPRLEPHSTSQMRGLAAPVQVVNQTFGPTSTPQPANQPRPSNQMPIQMVSTPPHLRARLQTPAGGPSSNINRTLIDGQHYQQPMTAPHQAASRTRQLPTTPIQIQTSRAHPVSTPRPVDGTSYGPGDRGPSLAPGRMMQTVSRTQDLVDVQSDQGWRPAGRMRGSLTGRAYSEALNQFVIRPTQQTTPTPPGQSPNTNQINLTPALQALLANRNLHSSSQPNPSHNNNNNNS